MTVHSNHSDFIQKATSIVEAHIDNDQFGVSELAREMGMSRSNLHRKVKSASKTSVSQFIRQVRLKQAMELLKQTSSTASEVAYKVGFGSVTYFTKCFHDYYGFPPGEVGQRESLEYNSGDSADHDLNTGIRKKRLTITFLITGFVVVIAVIVLVFILKPFNTRQEILDKSIAVLPFRNDSPEEEKMYFINGTMEAILDNLCKIEDLRVVSRTSVEQYRNNPKAMSAIAEEMNVSYILEGSGQKLGNRILLTIQLLDGKNDQHLWSKKYDREIQKVEDLIDIQSGIAQLVAEEIKAIVTPEEKQLIEKIPTTSQTAYDFYMRAREEHRKSIWNNPNRSALEKAEDLYRYALEYDSTFAQPYVSLGRVHWQKRPWIRLATEYAIDTILKLADIAISFDDQCASAYRLRGLYYDLVGKEDQAIAEYDKAIELNPNNGSAYFNKAFLYWNFDPLLTIENLYKAVILDRGGDLAFRIRGLSMAFIRAGFNEKAQCYRQEALEIDGDSASYLDGLSHFEFYQSNFETAIEFGLRGYALNPKNKSIQKNLARSYLFLEQFDTSLKYYKEFIEIEKSIRDMIVFHSGQVGYCFSMNGHEAEANYYLDEQIKYCKEMIQRNNESKKIEGYFLLAAVYASRGDKVKAYENLRIFNQWQKFPLTFVTFIKNDPMFDSIRDEPEFQQIVRDIDSKYQAEHERVRKWLEENDLL